MLAAERLGVNEHFQVLTGVQMRERISSPVFRGALYRKVGATVHPARLARGMRRVLLERGVRIFDRRRSRASAPASPPSPRRPAAPSRPAPPCSP